MRGILLPCMAVIREFKRKYFDGLASEFTELKKVQPGLTYESFIKARGIQCSVATFCRRLNACLERMALGIAAGVSAPWDILTPFLLGAYLGFLDIWNDHNRKGHTCSLSAAISKFRQWAAEHGYNLDATSDDRLREIAKHRAMARMNLPRDGMSSATTRISTPRGWH